MKGKTGQGRDRARATAARSSLLTWPGRQSGRQSNGEERSAVRGGPLAHSLTKEPAYSSILSPHACLVKSLCQQQLHPPRGGDARRRWREPRGSPRNLNT